MSSSVARGNNFELEISRILRRVGIECYRIRPGPGDGGVDITGNFVRIPIIIQCKDQRRGIGPAVVRELEGVLTKCHEDTIGIVVVPAKNKFNDGAVERAGTSKCNIILTDKRDLYLDLIR
ncbi:20837_t:CDS:2, partial [Entrophospora sp. SA101]